MKSKPTKVLTSENIEISDVVGTSGRYQLFAGFMAFYLMSVSGFLGVFVQFLAPEVHLSWQSEQEVTNGTVFKSTDCKLEEVYAANSSFPDGKLAYYSLYSRSTLTEKLGLVCENSWLISLANCFLMVGAVIWTIIIGQLSEKYGRRIMLLLLPVAPIAANLAILLAQEYTTFAIACFVYGGSIFAINNAAFITIVELSSISRRPIWGATANCGLVFGQVVMASLACGIQHWFYTQLAHLVYATIPILFIWYILESPSWLVIRGQEEEACNVLRVIVARNGMDAAEAEPKILLWLQRVKESATMQKKLATESTFWDLFATSTIRVYSLSVSFVLFSLFFIFFGLSMNMESLGSDLFQDLLISNGLSAAAIFVCVTSLTRFSLRVIGYCCKLLLTFFCILYPFLYGYPVARSVLAGMVRFAVTPPLNTIISYAAEIYPTSLRSIGFAFATTMARAAATLSPFIKELGVNTAVYVPFILFGLLSLASALLLIFVLPETRGKPLAHTVQELEAMTARKRKPVIVPTEKESDSV